MSHQAGAVEDTEEAPIITADEVRTILVGVDSVNVRAIRPLGIDALDVPAELDGARFPFDVFQVRSTGGVL